MKKEITFLELKESGFQDKTINQEIQSNLIIRLKSNEKVSF